MIGVWRGEPGRWSPWGAALCDEVEEATGEGGAELGPITLSGYDADRRWRLRDTLSAPSGCYLLRGDAYA